MTFAILNCQSNSHMLVAGSTHYNTASTSEFEETVDSPLTSRTSYARVFWLGK